MRTAACWLLALAACAVASSCAQRKAPGSPAIEQPARQFVDLMAAGDFPTATGRFDDAMKQAMPADKLREAWGALLQKGGPFRSQSGVRTTTEQGYDVAYVTCQFANGAVDVKVVFDKAGRISGLWFVPAR